MQKILELSTEIKNQIKELALQGAKDTEISKLFNIDRKEVGRFRKENNIASYKDVTTEKVEQIRNLCSEGKCLSKITKEVKMSSAKIKRIAKDYNITIPSSRIITKEIELELLNLYNQGLMDSEISKKLNISQSTIYYYRSTHNLPTKFTYDKISKIDTEKFVELFNKGLSDYAIAKELNMSPDGVYSYRMRYSYLREDLRLNKAIELSDFQKQVLLGTMLGDSSFKMTKASVNPAISCAHGVKQKEYCEYKTKIFENLGAVCTYHKRNIPDKRNNKYYEDYTMYVPANPKLKDWYNAFYKKGRKVIPFELFDNFTEVSLAFMFMDDGSNAKYGCNIATNCFSEEELRKFRIFLFEKFNLETSMHKSHSLYIHHKSKKLFMRLISPYIIDCMQYKLISVS